MKVNGEVEIVLNPPETVWKQIRDQMSKTEGWSFASTDYETWKNGFEKFWLYIAVEKASGKPVASVSLALDKSHEGLKEDDLYAVAVYYCNPEWRGSGLATRLFDIIMEIAGDSNMVLNGVPEMVPLYSKKYGFSLFTDYAYNYGSIETKHIVNQGTVEGYTTKLLTEVNWMDVVAYDRSICPIERSKYLKLFIDNQGCYTRVVFDNSDRIVGFGCAREDEAGNLAVGPLYADSKDGAQSLLSNIMGMIDLPKFGKMGFTFPEVNKDAEELLSLFSDGPYTCKRYVQTQFTKKIVKSDVRRVYSMIECGNSLV